MHIVSKDTCILHRLCVFVTYGYIVIIIMIKLFFSRFVAVICIKVHVQVFKTMAQKFRIGLYILLRQARRGDIEFQELFFFS